MPFITRENAKQLSEQGNAKRWSPENRLLAAQSKPAEAPQAPKEIPKPAIDDFQAKTLLRVRKQIKSLLDQMDEEEEPQKLDRLAAALGRLNEIERQLAGRPMPGSLKPSSKPARIQVQAEPTPIAPQPVVSDSPAQTSVNDT